MATISHLSSKGDYSWKQEIGLLYMTLFENGNYSIYPADDIYIISKISCI